MLEKGNVSRERSELPLLVVQDALALLDALVQRNDVLHTVETVHYWCSGLHPDDMRFWFEMSIHGYTHDQKQRDCCCENFIKSSSASSMIRDSIFHCDDPIVRFLDQGFGDVLILDDLLDHDRSKNFISLVPLSEGDFLSCFKLRRRSVVICRGLNILSSFNDLGICEWAFFRTSE